MPFVTNQTKLMGHKNAKAVIAVKEGKIRGIKRKSVFSGVEYFCFLGIPYGQSTAGQARFKDPVKVKPWKDVLDCTIEKDGCLQYSMRRKELNGSEDCLYNNIYTPKIPAEDEPLKAVIVCYHPGGLAHGSPDPWNYGSPEYIMHHDVVYVCVAFRLHILGFLNLGLKECSGNQGLKDVLLSLQWIKENIQVFGGDPENITIMGSGTGAGIVHDLMIIPKAKELFHKALLMGMYKSCPLHLAAEENASLAFEIATRFNYPNENTDKKNLLSFYKKLDLKNIFLWTPDLFFRSDKSSLFITSHFVTTPDSGEMAVVPPLSRQQQIQSMARIPIMVGFCEREASMAFSRLYKKGTMKDVYGLIRSNYFGWGYNLSDDKIKLIQKRVEEFYLGGTSIANAPLSTKCDILTDASLSDVYDSLINVIASGDPSSSVFVYKFNFQGNAFTVNEYLATQFEEPLKGACHEADFNHWAYTEYRWGNKTDSLTPKTCEIIETFTKYITTFAKTGNPNSQNASIQWEPSMMENPCYLYIGDTLQMVQEKLNGKRLEFWENLKYECLSE